MHELRVEVATSRSRSRESGLASRVAEKREKEEHEEEKKNLIHDIPISSLSLSPRLSLGFLDSSVIFSITVRPISSPSICEPPNQRLDARGGKNMLPHATRDASRYSNWTHLSSYANPAVRVLRKSTPATRPTAEHMRSDASDLSSPNDQEEEDTLLVGDED